VLQRPDRANNRRRRHLGRTAGNDSRRRSVSNNGLLLGGDDHPLLVNVLQVRLEVGLLFELFGANVARILVVALPVNAHHVSAQAALALELLEADVAVKSRSLMFSLASQLSNDYSFVPSLRKIS